jgi:uncharacterized Zn-binding protein involved in type VI secretion
VAGSPNVNVNGRPAIRVDDPGIHTACCGGNTWNAQTGSKSVFINGKPAHRLGDVVRHCGGVGKCIEGSGNVFVGDNGGSGTLGSSSSQSELLHFVEVVLVDLSGAPVANIEYTLNLPNGSVIRRKTDSTGRLFHDKQPDGSASISLPETYHLEDI